VALLLLDSIADGPLHKAGESGALLGLRGLVAEVERLLALPRVRKHVEGLVLAWLDADRVTSSNKAPRPSRPGTTGSSRACSRRRVAR
jgi:hypothetical protein